MPSTRPTTECCWRIGHSGRRRAMPSKEDSSQPEGAQSDLSTKPWCPRCIKEPAKSQSKSITPSDRTALCSQAAPSPPTPERARPRSQSPLHSQEAEVVRCGLAVRGRQSTTMPEPSLKLVRRRGLEVLAAALHPTQQLEAEDRGSRLGVDVALQPFLCPSVDGAQGGSRATEQRGRLAVVGALHIKRVDRRRSRPPMATRGRD